MLGLEEKQNNTVKLTLNELLCGFLGESLLIFHCQSEQVLSTSLIYWLDDADTKLLFEIKLRDCDAPNSLCHLSEIWFDHSPMLPCSLEKLFGLTLPYYCFQGSCMSSHFLVSVSIVCFVYYPWTWMLTMTEDVVNIQITVVNNKKLPKMEWVCLPTATFQVFCSFISLVC